MTIKCHDITAATHIGANTAGDNYMFYCGVNFQLMLIMPHLRSSRSSLWNFVQTIKDQ